MASSATAKTTYALRLIPVNLHDEQEVLELLEQRHICGWNYMPSNIDTWRRMMDEGTKTMFWITLPAPEHIRAGHISLASQSTPPHDELARLDKTVMTISTFFTMPEYRGQGLGIEAMDQLTDLAKHSPYGSERCASIAIDTMRKEDDTDAWSDLWASKGLQAPVSMEPFYVRRGYVKFHEESRYEDSCPQIGPLHVKAAFLRKTLR